MCHKFSIQQAVTFVYGSIEDHMFDGISKILIGFSLHVPKKKCFYTLKMSLLRIIWKSNLPKYSIHNKHVVLLKIAILQSQLSQRKNRKQMKIEHWTNFTIQIMLFFLRYISWSFSELSFFANCIAVTRSYRRWILDIFMRVSLCVDYCSFCFAQTTNPILFRGRVHLSSLSTVLREHLCTLKNKNYEDVDFYLYIYVSYI